MRDAHGSFVFLGTLLSVHLKLLMYESFIHPRMGTVLPFFQLSQVLPHAGMKCTRKTWNIPGRDQNYAGMVQWILGCYHAISFWYIVYYSSVILVHSGILHSISLFIVTLLLSLC